MLILWCAVVLHHRAGEPDGTVVTRRSSMMRGLVRAT
jgi:hypothetical protein